MSDVRATAWRAGRRAVDWSAARLRLVSYVPHFEYRDRLAAHTTYREDPRPIRDKRATTILEDGSDLTLTSAGLEDALAGRDWHGGRILEVGPKYGTHSRWVDLRLEPSELVFSDFRADAQLHEPWVGELQAPHRFVYGDLRHARELLELAPFDAVLFLGVLYHSIHHLALLGMLNRVTREGGEMLLETSIDPRPDAALRLRWQTGSGKAKAEPTVDALRLELAWTGWRDVTRLVDYRPGSGEALFLCRKTDELPEDAETIDLVAPQRVEPPA